MNTNELKALENRLDGTILNDKLTKTLYATDASVYRKTPLAVAFPKSKKDLKELISFADAKMQKMQVYKFATVLKVANKQLLVTFLIIKKIRYQ